MPTKTSLAARYSAMFSTKPSNPEFVTTRSETLQFLPQGPVTIGDRHDLQRYAGAEQGGDRATRVPSHALPAKRHQAREVFIESQTLSGFGFGRRGQERLAYRTPYNRDLLVRDAEAHQPPPSILGAAITPSARGSPKWALMLHTSVANVRTGTRRPWRCFASARPVVIRPWLETKSSGALR